MATMFHGTRNDGLALHVGLCLTDDADVAAHYGRTVHEVELSLGGLTVRTVDSFDMDSVTALGDAAADCAALAADGVDVIVYEDQSPEGRTHNTWRVVSERGLAALSI